VGFFSNLSVFAGAGIMFILQLLFTYVPAMNTAFHSRPIGLDSWVRILAAASLIVVVVGIEKFIVRRREKRGLP
jgi:magnesium-transporting ATPase (P-type)